MTDPDIRQVLVHPAVWPYLELWLAAHNLVLAQVPVEDDLPTYAMVTADAGDAGKVLAAGVRDAARQASGQQPDNATRVAELEAEIARLHDKHKASLLRADEVNNELMEEVQRYAEGTERPVLWSVYNRMHNRALTAEAKLTAAPAAGLSDTQPVNDRAAVLREAAAFLRDAHFQDGMTVQEIGTALLHMADEETSR
jgi:hypothetical protein